MSSTFVQSSAVLRIKKISKRPVGNPSYEGIASLAVGEPDFDTPRPIVQAMIDALNSGITHYGFGAGDPELIEQIVVESNKTSFRAVSADSVVITHGGNAAITAAVLATVDPGDRVVIPEPTYSLYADAVAMAGGIPVFVGSAEGFRLDLDEIRAVSVGAKMIMLCNPVNPTGVVASASELAAVAHISQSTGALVMVDEAYADLVYGPSSFPHALGVPGLAGSLILVRTFSKSFAMTGWRIGYVVAPPAIAATVRLAHRSLNGAINPAVQRAAFRALQIGEPLITPMLDEYRSRRTLILDGLHHIESLHATAPAGAFYVFVHYPFSLDSVQMASYLLEHGVAVRPGIEYGPSGENHVRLSFATDAATITTALDRLAEATSTLVAPR